MSTFELLSIILTSLTLMATSLIIVQIRLARKHKRDEHEEIRRVKTVEVIMAWSQSLKKETSFANRIVEHFSPDQCTKLYKQEAFEVTEEVMGKICDICQLANTLKCKECKNHEHKKYIIKDLALSELRWYIISYLNMIESVLIAWQMGIVDRKTIEHQFSYLYDPKKQKNVLEAFRNAAGGVERYPAIDAFCKQLQDIKNPSAKSKDTF